MVEIGKAGTLTRTADLVEKTLSKLNCPTMDMEP